MVSYVCPVPTLRIPASPVIIFLLNDSWQIGTDNRVSLNVNSSESVGGRGLFIGKTRGLPSGAEAAFLSATIKPVTQLLFSQSRFCLIKIVRRRECF